MRILFVGLGAMGVPMARRMAPEHDLVLVDPRPDLAVLAEDMSADYVTATGSAPTAVDAVILMLPDSRVVEAVLEGPQDPYDPHDGQGPDGLLDRLAPGTLIVDMSSAVPESTRRLAGLARALGIAYVDAPVSGGVAKARTGELAVMAGGRAEDVRRAAALVAPMAASVTHVGPSGSGHAAKALNNLLAAANLVAAAEVLTVARRFGIDAATMLDVLNQSTGRNQATEVKFPQHVLTGGFASGFAMDLMIKDLGIARKLADDFHVESPLTAQALEVALAARRSLPEPHPDHTRLVEWYEHRNDIALRGSTTDDGSTTKTGEHA
ncbi:NAD(P)-dependent oxidoreductase [Streptomyces sp. NPDC057257]|uniref:NAD(P)-dependent oxidoreductase n=1 Tax=Streptomyces sp. NPDC057257 TaxID=3346071 RepID=UPI00363659BF